MRFAHKSAECLRQQLAQSPSWLSEQPRIEGESTRLDKEMRLLLDNENTRFVLRDEAGAFHRISDHYYCTTGFLNSVLAAIIDPTTKGALRRVQAQLRQSCGYMGHFMPSNREQLLTSLFELTLNLPEAQEMFERSLPKSRAQKCIE